MNFTEFAAPSCAQIQHTLETCLNQDLPGHVTKHLAACPTCAAVQTETQRLRHALQTAVNRSEPAPAWLHLRIRNELAQAAAPTRAARQLQSLQPHGWQHWWARLIPLQAWGFAAVTAAFALAVFSYSWGPRGVTSTPTTVAEITTSTSAANVQLLNVGLQDHIHCAVARDYSAGPQSFAQLALDLGSDFSSLIPAVQAQIPPGFAVQMAHHCTFEERDFVHLILVNQQTLLSLILTRKNGETFDTRNVSTIVHAAGVPLHHTREQNYTVAGFETPKYLGYVVSNLPQTEHLQLAAQLAPSVRAWLLNHAG